MNTKKIDITDSKMLANEGICFLCEDCANNNLKMIQEFNNFKKCDVVGCENATSKTYDLKEQFNNIIKIQPERNPVLKRTDVSQLVKEGLLFDSGDHRLWATYDFFNRYQDILNDISVQRDSLILQNHYLDLNILRGNKIMLEVKFWNDDDISCCEIGNELISKPNEEFSIDDVVLIANTFATRSCSSFHLTKNYLKIILEQ